MINLNQHSPEYEQGAPIPSQGPAAYILKGSVKESAMEKQPLKGEILSTGALVIYRPRRSGFVGQICKCVFNADRNCGDDCPAFDEPGRSEYRQEVTLHLCFGQLVFDDFEDGREV